MEAARLICGGNSHSLIITEEKSIHCTGWNGRGQFGIPPLNDGQKIITYHPPFDAKEVTAGQSHSAFLDTEGNVWTCGWNEFGQLGLGDFIENHKTATKIENLPRIISVSTKYNHCILLDESGDVWIFGWNSSGQLGLGHKNNVSNPEKLNDLPRIQAVSAGREHSLFLDEDGNVWGCGSNECGQLGQLSAGQDYHHKEVSKYLAPIMLQNLPKIQQISAGLTHSALLDCESNAWLLSEEDQYKVKNLPRTKFLSSGTLTYFLDFDGEVWKWVGTSACLQKIEGLPFICTIAAGIDFAHFVDKDGHIWSYGANSSEQLAPGGTRIVVPTQTITVRIRMQSRVATKSARKV